MQTIENTTKMMIRYKSLMKEYKQLQKIHCCLIRLRSHVRIQDVRSSDKLKQFGHEGNALYWSKLSHKSSLLQNKSKEKSEMLSRRWYASTENPVDNVMKSQVRQSRIIETEGTKLMKAGQVKKFLEENEISFEEGYTCHTLTCPKFAKTRGKKKTEVQDKLFVNMTTGFFLCQVCKKSGNWHSLQKYLKQSQHKIKGKKKHECFEGIDLVEDFQSSVAAKKMYNQSIEFADLDRELLEDILHDLGIEAIHEKSLEKFGVKVTMEKNGLIFPYFGVDGALVGVKIFTTKGEKSNTLVTSIPSSFSFHFLYGLNTVEEDTEEIILTASELDAIAAYQNSGKPALALPQGESVLPIEVLPLFEQFKKITLWFGGSVRSYETARVFAKKLNNKRCYLIKPDSSHPRALDALKNGISIESIVKGAKHIPHKSIVTFAQLRHDVLSEMTHADQVAGIKWARFPPLNDMMKGHRRGELTVFTGGTGSGKTTFISEYSLDLCMQGVNTLWGSFEINNVRLMKNMLTQYAKLNLTKNISQFEYWADRFEQELQMYFMTFHGEQNVRTVIDTMTHAMYVHDIAHVIVDNLQFMMGVGYNVNSENRYMKQDQIIASFRKFATTNNCHVTLVIHPRKERDPDDLTMSSIFGSAKASQEADNVMILQDKRLMSTKGRKYIELVKNRFDGDLGMMNLHFDKETLTFTHKAKSKDAKKKKKEDIKVNKPVKEDREIVEIEEIGLEFGEKIINDASTLQ